MLLLLFATGAQAQVTGVLQGSFVDSAARPLQGVFLQLVHGTDTGRTVTDADGAFRFDRLHPQEYRLTAIHAGGILFDTSFSINAAQSSVTRFPPLVLQQLPKELGEIIVRPPPVTILEDTVQFNAAAFVVRESANVEELIRKFPGITVDRDGNITAQGQSVVRVLLNGKEFFAGDIKTATQNLPAEIVRNIQIIDDYGEQANLTGIKSGEPQKIININTKKSRNKGEFGNILAGIGTDNRYLARGAINRFRNDQQLSIIASTNNTSVNPDGIGGGTRGRSLGTASASPGITTTSTVGLSYRDKWSEKLTVNGNYSFSHAYSEIENTSFQQDLNPLDIRTTRRNSDASSTSVNHRLNLTMEYVPTTRSLIKVTALGSLAGSRSSSDAASILNRSRFATLTQNLSDVTASSPGMSVSLHYSNRFKKAGRVMTLSATIDQSSQNERTVVNNVLTDIDSAGVDSTYLQPSIDVTNQRQRQETGSNRSKPAVTLSYTEPLTSRTVAELNYAITRETLDRRRDVYDQDSGGNGSEILNPGLTNDYQSTFLVNRIGLNVQTKREKFNYLLGVIFQPSALDGFSRSRSMETRTRNLAWAPTARFVYRFTPSQTLTLNYNGNYTEPDYQKLQPLIDSTNPSNIIIGNPNLRPEFSNRVSASYNASNRESGSAVFSNLSYDRTINKIVNSIYNDARSTSRTTTYLNDDGFYRLSGNTTFSQPFSERRFTVSAGMTGNFENTIAYTDNQRSAGQSWRLQPNLRIQADVPNVVDAQLTANYTFNRTEAVYGSQVLRTDATAFVFGFFGRVFFRKNLFLECTFDKQINSGLGSGTNASPNILNLFLEYEFARNNAAAIRLHGYDLLNQNERISRSVNGTSITDNRFNGLRRYFMLTFGWRLRHFNA